MKPACPQCGASLVFAGSLPLITCGHCSSSLWVDLGSVLLHTAMTPVLDESQARRMTRASGARGAGVKTRGTARLVWRPFWLYTRAAAARMAPADSELRAELDECPALAGRERGFAAAADATSGAMPPNVPLAAVLGPALGRAETASARPRLVRLVHVPFWELSAPSGSVAIDAVEGRLRLSPAEPLAVPDTRTRKIALALAVAFFAATFLPGALPPLVAALVIAAVGYAQLSGAFR